MKTPTEIRNVLIDEARRLSDEGAMTPAQGLLDFANLAKDDELTRFAELLTDHQPADFWDPTTKAA